MRCQRDVGHTNIFYNHGPITLHARFVLLSTDPFVWKLCVAVLSRLFFGAVSCESRNYLQTLSDQQTIFKLCIFPPSSYSLMNLNRRSSWLENHHFLIQMWKNESKRLLLRHISSWGQMKGLINDYYCSPSQDFPHHLFLYQVYLIWFDNFLSDFSCLLRPPGLK